MWVFGYLLSIAKKRLLISEHTVTNTLIVSLLMKESNDSKETDESEDTLMPLFQRILGFFGFLGFFRQR